MAELVQTIYKSEPDNLIGGSVIPLLQKVVTIAAGEGALKRGTILGKAADGKMKVVKSTNTDGSQKADCVLRHDVDATTAVEAVAYSQGMFNKSALIVGEGDTVAAHENELRAYNIILTDFEGGN